MPELSTQSPTPTLPEAVKTKTKRAPTEYNIFCAETLKTLSGFPPKERLTECGRLWKLKQSENGKVSPTKDTASTENAVVPSAKAKKEPSAKVKDTASSENVVVPSAKAKKEPSAKVKKSPSAVTH